jgi:hypothetical protein
MLIAKVKILEQALQKLERQGSLSDRNGSSSYRCLTNEIIDEKIRL